MPAALGILLVIITVPTTSWAGFSAQEVDTANVFSAGTVQLEGTTSSVCYSTGTGSGGTISSNVAACPGSPLPTGQLSTGSVASATSSLSDTGSATPQSADLSLSSCGAAEVADSTGTGDTGLVYGGVTYGTPFASPVNSDFTSSALSLTGASGTYVSTIRSVLSPASFTVVAWIKTTTTTGGGVLGFSSEQPDRTGTADRMLWVEPTGQLSFGVFSNLLAMEVVTSTSVVNDGKWHFVAATLSYPSISIDVDGTVTNATTAFPGAYTGYWHLGWAGDSSWPSPGTNQYFAGSEFGVGVYPVLTAANLATLEDASSASSFATAATVLSPAELWLLSDSGTVVYTGTIPVLGATPLCKDVLIDVQTTVGTSTTCAFPAGPAPCPATPPASATLSTLGSDVLPTVSPSGSMTVTVRMTLAIASAPGILGLHLLAGLDFETTASGWTAELEYPTTTLDM